MFFLIIFSDSLNNEIVPYFIFFLSEDGIYKLSPASRAMSLSVIGTLPKSLRLLISDGCRFTDSKISL